MSKLDQQKTQYLCHPKQCPDLKHLTLYTTLKLPPPAGAAAPPEPPLALPPPAALHVPTPPKAGPSGGWKSLNFTCSVKFQNFS